MNVYPTPAPLRATGPVHHDAGSFAGAPAALGYLGCACGHDRGAGMAGLGSLAGALGAFDASYFQSAIQSSIVQSSRGNVQESAHALNVAAAQYAQLAPTDPRRGQYAPDLTHAAQMLQQVPSRDPAVTAESLRAARAAEDAAAAYRDYSGVAPDWTRTLEDAARKTWDDLKRGADSLGKPLAWGLGLGAAATAAYYLGGFALAARALARVTGSRGGGGRQRKRGRR